MSALIAHLRVLIAHLRVPLRICAHAIPFPSHVSLASALMASCWCRCILLALLALTSAAVGVGERRRRAPPSMLPERALLRRGERVANELQ